MAAASLGAGIIHFAVAPSHFGEYWLFGAFFFGAGLFQVATPALLLFTLNPSLVAMSVVVNGLIPLIWLASRTTGLPVGPHPFTAEDVGSADATATVLEVLIVAGGILLLTSARKGGERILRGQVIRS
jgi:hypothetical protein